MSQNRDDQEAQAETCWSASSSESSHHVKDFRRVRDDIPWRVWVVATIGFWERAAFWGLLAPWQNYMEHPPHFEKGQTPGALGLGQAVATRIYCCFYIFYYVAPIFVAIVADSKLGQYNSLVISFVLYCLGIVALTVSSLPVNIDNGWGVPGLVIAMFLVGLGGGGVKAIMPPFLADQYTETEPRFKTLKTGEKVVTDRELTLQYIYSLSFWMGNVGSLIWFATVFIEKKHGFAAAFGLTLGLIAIALVMLIAGRPWYVQVSHKDNLIVPQATKIVACAVKNGFTMKRADPAFQFERYSRKVSWTGSMVDELTRGLRACRVLLAFVVFWVCFDQMQNNLISQAGQMDMKSTPNDLLPAMNQVGCIIVGPLVQMVLYPFLHRRKIYLGPIMRITIGFGFMALAMLYATIVQHAIYMSPPCFDNASDCEVALEQRNRPNVWLQAPIYFLISTGEVFAYVTGIEYAYEHSPKHMKAIVQAIGLLVAGMGSVVALALTPVAHDPSLVIFYSSLTGAMTLTAVAFWLMFRTYDRKPSDVIPQKKFETSVADLEKADSAQENNQIVADSPDDEKPVSALPLNDKPTKLPGLFIKEISSGETVSTVSSRRSSQATASS